MSVIIAYIDAGTGSFVLQAVIGVGLGVTYVVRNRIRGVISKFKKTNETEKPNDS